MIVQPEDLDPANSFLQLIVSIVTVAVPVLGATVYAAFGPQTMVLVLVALYLLARPCLALVPAGKPERVSTARPSLGAKALAGLRYLRASRVLVALTLGPTILWLGAKGLGVMDVVFVTRALHLETATAGVLMAAYGAGNVVGGTLAWLTSRRVHRHQHVVLWVTNAVIGSALLAYAVTPTLLLATGALFLVGLPVPALIVAWSTLTQLSASDVYLDRVMSLVNMTSSVAKIISLSGVGCWRALSEYERQSRSSAHFSC
jgi:hypothetical protein